MIGEPVDHPDDRREFRIVSKQGTDALRRDGKDGMAEAHAVGSEFEAAAVVPHRIHRDAHANAAAMRLHIARRAFGKKRGEIERRQQQIAVRTAGR